MDQSTVASAISAEREKLSARQAELLQDRKAIDQELHGIERELRALAAYESAKNGKAVRGPSGANGERKQRRGSRRNDILKVVEASARGMTRGELIEYFRAKGDKSAEMSISNALTALTKNGSLARQGGRYVTA